MSTGSQWRSYGKSALNSIKAQYFLRRAARFEGARFYTSLSFQMDLNHAEILRVISHCEDKVYSQRMGTITWMHEFLEYVGNIKIDQNNFHCIVAIWVSNLISPFKP